MTSPGPVTPHTAVDPIAVAFRQAEMESTRPDMWKFLDGLAAVRPLIEAATERRIVLNLWKYGDVSAEGVAAALGDKAAKTISDREELVRAGERTRIADAIDAEAGQYEADVRGRTGGPIESANHRGLVAGLNSAARIARGEQP